MYKEPLGRNWKCSLSAKRTPFFSHLMVTGGCPWAWQSRTARPWGEAVTSLGSVIKDSSLKDKTPRRVEVGKRRVSVMRCCTDEMMKLERIQRHKEKLCLYIEVRCLIISITNVNNYCIVHFYFFKNVFLSAATLWFPNLGWIKFNLI